MPFGWGIVSTGKHPDIKIAPAMAAAVGGELRQLSIAGVPRYPTYKTRRSGLTAKTERFEMADENVT